MVPELVKNYLPSMEPEELRTDYDCEMTWVQITLTGVSNLYVGAFYRPPDSDNPVYLAQLDTCLSRIPENAHIWLSGDFNLADINWTDSSVKGSASTRVPTGQGNLVFLQGQGKVREFCKMVREIRKS